MKGILENFGSVVNFIKAVEVGLRDSWKEMIVVWARVRAVEMDETVL